MMFRRHRLFARIMLVILWVFFGLYVTGAIVGLIISMIYQSFLIFWSVFFGCGHAIAITILIIRIINWLLNDFEDLDNRIKTIENKINR